MLSSVSISKKSGVVLWQRRGQKSDSKLIVCVRIDSRFRKEQVGRARLPLSHAARQQSSSLLPQHHLFASPEFEHIQAILIADSHNKMTIPLSEIPTLTLLYKLGKLTPASEPLPDANSKWNDKISLVQVDITKLGVDAIVNVSVVGRRHGLSPVSHPLRR